VNRRRFLTGLTALPVAVACIPLAALAAPTKDREGTFIGAVGDAPLMTEMLPNRFAYRQYGLDLHGCFTIHDLVELVSKGCGGGDIEDAGIAYWKVYVNDPNSVEWLNDALYYKKPMELLVEVGIAPQPAELDGLVTMSYKKGDVTKALRTMEKLYEKG
jgi:hypothetical protein